jgi:hypothetical protein
MSVIMKSGTVIKKLFFPLFIAVIAVSALLGAETVKAVSAYDDTVHVREELILKHSGCTDLNVSLGWAVTIWQDSTAWTASGYGSSYATAQTIQDNAEYWAVNNRQISSTEWRVGIVYTTNTNAVVNFAGTTPNTEARFAASGGTDTVASVTAYLDGSCNIRFDSASIGSSVSTFPLSTEDGSYGVFLAFVSAVNYPSGYEGTDIPDTYSPPVDPVDYWINYTYTAGGSSLIATYNGKITDPTSSLADPASIWWQLRDPEDPDMSAYEATVVCEANLLVNVPFNISQHCDDFTPELRSYILVGKINPLNPANEDLWGDAEINFRDTWFTINFANNSFGDTENCEPGALAGDFVGLNCVAPETVDFTACFTESFPFVDPFECVDSMKLLVSLLSFKTIRFGNEYNQQAECHNLTTIGDWIGAPGLELCPQFSGTIRTILTPFVMFILGLITLKFLTKREGYL